ncbi:MAG TPA: aminotransferase class I/II-fold pyridoxal phosphate-dependent enzyme [Longimicrobium sp.]|jgi:dTDP-4-amino-4,6-dideoxygalactose transaminase
MALPNPLQTTVEAAGGVSDGGAATLPALLGGPASVHIPGPHFRWPLIEADDEEAVLAQLRSGELSYHRRAGVVAEFEDAFASYHEVPFAMSANSGSAALHAAFFALDLEPGDEVLAPAYTHLSTVLPMLHCHLVPVLCDVEEETGNLDLADAEPRIGPRTRAMVVTHQYGHVCDMPAVLAFARKHGLRVVEDCSHAHGATLDGRLAGTFGDAGCFSLQAHKAVPAGEGGVLICSDPRVMERAALLGHFRQRTPATTDAYAPFAETGYGLKNRLHPLGAALALSQLRKLPRRIEARRANLSYFDDQLRGVPGVRPLPTAPGVSRGGYFRYLVRYDAAELDGLPVGRYVEALRAEGVLEVSPGSLARPLHLTPIFQTLDDRMYSNGWPRRGPHTSRTLVYGPGDFPRAERFSATTLQFPAFTEPSFHIIAAYRAAMVKVARHASLLAEGA